MRTRERFQDRRPVCFGPVCSTLHLTALPPMSSTCVGMSGYNVQAMRLLRVACLVRWDISLADKAKLYHLVF